MGFFLQKPYNSNILCFWSWNLVFVCLSCKGSYGLSQLCFNWKMLFWIFPSFIEEEKWTIFRSACHPFLLPEPFLLQNGSKCSFSSPSLWPFGWLEHSLLQPIQSCSLSSVTITFATSQQYQTYLSTASVWFSHSSELWSLPKSAAQLALLLEWPIPLLRWGRRKEVPTTETGNQLEPNTQFCIDRKTDRKAMYLQEKNGQHQKVWEILISSPQLGQETADITNILNFLFDLKETEH